MPQRAVRIISLGHSDLAATGEAVARTIEAAKAAGFDAAIWAAAGSLFDAEPVVPEAVVVACRQAGLNLLIEIDIARVPIDHPLVEAHPAAFAIRRSHTGDMPVDPRVSPVATGEAWARLRWHEAIALLRQPLLDAVRNLLSGGVSGLRLAKAERLAPSLIDEVADAVRAMNDTAQVIVGAGDLPQTELRELSGTSISGVVSSFGGWDLRAPWLIEEYETLRGIAPLLSEIRPEDLGQADEPAFIARRLAAAAALGHGIIVPVSLLAGGDEVRHALAHALDITRAVDGFSGEMRRLSGSGSRVTALLRGDAADMRAAGAGLLLLINTDLQPQAAPDPTLLLPGAGAEFGAFHPAFGSGKAFGSLAGGEVRLLVAERAMPITATALPTSDAAVRAGATDRLVIEEVSPVVDGGDFAVKRLVGERVTVEATMYADGHEQLAANLLYRAVGDERWVAVRMAQLPNDRWRGDFILERLGRHEFMIQGWLDRFGGFQRDFAKKRDAGVAQAVDHAEGLALVDQAVARGADLSDWPARLAAARDDDSAALLLSPELGAAMDVADDHPHHILSAVQMVDAERLAARFSSWYELFPRSITDDASRHGTFEDVIGRLPAIRDMGFDTLYFPPIHPIGRAHRKGPNNTLTAGLDDPGSPYAIGSADGGHDAIHPELGDFAAFDRLVKAAADQGLEIALDFAIQASPDHPWLTEHPGWFAWRPDGSMKYAENPPKKYQDIVNVDFYGPDAVPGLWLALRDVILLWVDHGVKTFRVDNPHTKPLPFWEWMIGEVRGQHPDVIFLAEAFTRPSMMYRLAKIGFSQSYTYFTWRDGKVELVDYITELTTTAPKDFYRPHFFVNTPDINPPFLQTSGRPGFRIRAVLAATLSGLFGVYSGFELCEADAVPGKEEYLDSEKYIVKPRDWQAPGNIIADITLLNRLRRAYPALQTHLNTRFYPAYNDNIIYYAKPAPDGTDMILVMVNLDPQNAQGCTFELPLWEFGLSDDGTVAVEDLAGGYRFAWHGKTHFITLDPSEPYRIWRIAPGDHA